MALLGPAHRLLIENCSNVVASIFERQTMIPIFTGYRAVQVVVTEAGYGSLGISGHDLASQFDRKMSIHGRIKGNACVSFLLENRKR